MTERKHTKLIQAGRYVAEVDVTLIESGESWSPWLSVEDAAKLDAVREALQRGDVKAASKFSRVFTLKPVSA